MGMWWRKTEAESKGIVMDTLAKTCFSFRVVAPFFQVTRTPWPIVGITVRYPNPEVCTRPPRATKSEPQHLPSRTPLVAMLRDAARLDANDRRLPATQQSSGAEQKHGGGERVPAATATAYFRVRARARLARPPRRTPARPEGVACVVHSVAARRATLVRAHRAALRGRVAGAEVRRHRGAPAPARTHRLLCAAVRPFARAPRGRAARGGLGGCARGGERATGVIKDHTADQQHDQPLPMPAADLTISRCPFFASVVLGCSAP